jgi:Peptidase S24-like
MSDRDRFTNTGKESPDTDFRWDDVDVDAFIQWLGRHLYRRNPGAIEEDPRFMNWLTRDLRQRPPAPDDWSATKIRRMRQRILERAWAERCGIIDGQEAGEPSSRDVPGMPLGQSVDEASRAGCTAWTSLAAAAGEGRELWDEECERWLELPPTLVGTGGRFLALRVAGDSMTPLFHDGDTILVRLGPDVRRDSVIVARRPDNGYVVKRVGHVRGRTIELVSLNAAYDPIVVQRDPHTVLGTVIMRWCPHDGTVPLTR